MGIGSEKSLARAYAGRPRVASVGETLSPAVAGDMIVAMNEASLLEE